MQDVFDLLNVGHAVLGLQIRRICVHLIFFPLSVSFISAAMSLRESC